VVPKERSAVCETRANAKNSDLPFFSKQQHGPFGGKISSAIIKLSLQTAEHKVTLKEKGAERLTVSGEFGVFWVATFAPVRCICLRVTISTQSGYWHYSSFHQPSIISRANRSDRDLQSGLSTSDLASPFLIPVPTQQADLEARTSRTVAPIKPALTFSNPSLQPKSTSPGKVGTDTSNRRSRHRCEGACAREWEQERRPRTPIPAEGGKTGGGIDDLFNSLPTSLLTITKLPTCLTEH